MVGEVLGSGCNGNLADVNCIVVIVKRFALFAAICAAVFGAVLGALQFDRWMERRSVVAGLSTPTITGISASTEVAGSVPVDFRASVKKVLPSVVSVDKSQRQRYFFGNQVEMRTTGTGSGVIISRDGYIVTNNHVVQNADQVNVRLADKRSYVAKVVGADPRSDLAVLKIEATNLVPAELSDSAKLEIGEWVIAIGNPLGFSNTVSVGVVSSLNRSLPTDESVLLDAIQTDAAINQGNSGGALTNAQGQVVGINSAIATPSGGSVGLGFSIPVNRVKRVVDDILKFGRVKYGWLGVSIFQRGTLQDQGLREEYSRELGVEAPKTGIVITRVAPDSAASKAGIKNLDVIQQVDGVSMTDMVEYYKAFADKKPGDTVKLTVWSAGTARTITVTLQDLIAL